MDRRRYTSWLARIAAGGVVRGAATALGSGIVALGFWWLTNR